MIMAKPFKMWAMDKSLMSNSKTKSDHLQNVIRRFDLIPDKNKTMESCEHHWEYFLELLH